MTDTRLSTEDLVQPSPPAPREGDLSGAQGTADLADSTAVHPDDAPLVDDQEAADFLDRWSAVQARFVDDPQAAVRDGDSLVAELMQSLANRFAQCKSDLENQWQQGGEPQTEELRLALQQYRSFFQRLLST